MHELGVLREVVRMVETQLQAQTGTRVVVVRLRVDALSHLGRARPGDLELLFSMAAAGTRVAGASLEVCRVPAEAVCAGCGERCRIEEGPAVCPICGAEALLPAEGPEVTLDELVLR